MPDKEIHNPYFFISISQQRNHFSIEVIESWLHMMKNRRVILVIFSEFLVHVSNRI